MSEIPTPWAPAQAATVLELPGLEVDNLLAFLALLGLLRALEEALPGLQPRASWKGPPWRARLHLALAADERAVADAAARGTRAIAERFDADGRANVDFDHGGFRRYAARLRADSVGAALAVALATESPVKRDGGLFAGPLVMLRGQGHQNFLDRLIAVPRGEIPSRLKKLKHPPDLSAPGKIAEALFRPWSRTDDADGFRWDPDDDQRYALRFDDPSSAGAALTVHGANRLAAVGFLSFPSSPSLLRPTTRGAAREAGGPSFMWPVWTTPLSRRSIEAFLGDPRLVRGDVEALLPFGVADIYRAKRITNGKFMNVTRAMPVVLARSEGARGKRRLERREVSHAPGGSRRKRS